MKLFVLAASVGYVMAAARDAACGELTSPDPDATAKVTTACEDADFCDVGQTATEYKLCTVAGTVTYDSTRTPACEDSADTGTDASVPTAEATTADTGLCKEKIADGADCTADTDCKSGGCDTGGTAKCLASDGVTCVDDTTCAATACEGPCTLTKTCGANANADGDLGGCCDDTDNGGSPTVAVTDTALNYCKDGVVTATEPLADGATCDPTASNAATTLCASGTCTATADTTDAATVGTCDVTDGADGGDCLAAVTGQTACEDGVTLDNGADTTADTEANGGVDDFCKGATATALNTPAETLGSAAAGADGGAPREVIAARAGDDRCTGALVATIVTGGTAAAPTETSCKCGAAADDAPAAIFYGMSMVTAAVAYLL